MQGFPERNTPWRQLPPQLPGAGHSIGTTNRPINRATSSSCRASWSLTARASRTRHSSSLIDGTSCGTIDGITRSESMAGIEPPPELNRQRQAWFRNKTFCRPVRDAERFSPKSGAAEKARSTGARGRASSRYRAFREALASKGRTHFPLCKPRGLCYTQPARTLFLGSSVVEQPAVNRLVAGSNPARGANTINHFCGRLRAICYFRLAAMAVAAV
jgi:hypothetical protein